jgi:hypothetical protein
MTNTSLRIVWKYFNCGVLRIGSFGSKLGSKTLVRKGKPKETIGNMVS